MMKEVTQNSFEEILKRIKETRRNVFQKVNTLLVELYFETGRYISLKVEQEGWGKGVVKELASFIKEKEPDIKGFSDKNLWRMKQFYEVYKDNAKLATLWRVLSWSHNRSILSMTKTEEEREFYLNLCVKERYSVRELERQIKSGVLERTLLAGQKLSPAMKELPQAPMDAFKDSYVFEFLDLPPNHSEDHLQKALLGSLKDLLLELGKDFTFVGEEYRLQVGNSDFFVDLLFYHRELQCLVAIELKNEKFKPEQMGQLEFYLEALDRDVKKKHENPSIGILLCRNKDDEVVEYALSRSLSPAVVAEYETKLIPRELLRKKLNEFYELLENREENS